MEATTRVDAAHAKEPEAAAAPTQELLAAIAGNDPSAVGDQLRGQALQLATMLREKQRFLDQRESELNARTALLENDMRRSRLKKIYQQLDPPKQGEGHTLRHLQLETLHRWRETLTESATEPTPIDSILFEDAPSADDAPERPATPVTDDETTAAANHEPEVESCDEADPPEFSAEEDDEYDHDADPVAPFRHAPQAVAPPVPDEIAMPVPEAPVPEAPADVREDERIDLQADDFAQRCQAVMKRQAELDRRQCQVDQLFSETIKLHREALEMRLATEQLWSELVERFTSEELAKRLAAIRDRLTDHYRLANENLSQRQDEMHEMRQALNEQQQRLRTQRRELQLWIDRRYDEIESRTAQLITREREMDRLEAEFERQTLLWQKQRESFRDEVQRFARDSGPRDS